MTHSAILLIHCPDSTGLVARVSNFLFEHNGNILHADQHLDSRQGLFLMRVEWEVDGFDLDARSFAAAFEPIAKRYQMHWKLAESSARQKVALFVSKQDHCLADLLYRHQSGELACDISLVISNHRQAEPLARAAGIPFHHTPVDPEHRAAAEHAQFQLLDAANVDLIILARYMQVLSPDFVNRYPERIINVHHSFLPAFSGSHPYQRAYERGVKLIGATSHYATSSLDEGPIIEQDVERISHRDQPADLVRRGRDLEKVVLARAMRWHLEHRILVYANKTVVFA
jgi:formyltetrahydrofolate deformylase